MRYMDKVSLPTLPGTNHFKKCLSSISTTKLEPHRRKCPKKCKKPNWKACFCCDAHEKCSNCFPNAAISKITFLLLGDEWVCSGCYLQFLQEDLNALGPAGFKEGASATLRSVANGYKNHSGTQVSHLSLRNQIVVFWQGRMKNYRVDMIHKGFAVYGSDFKGHLAVWKCPI